MAKVEKKAKGPGVASMNPDNMSSAGLPDDFDGLITKVRLIPWDYDGKIDHHVLAVRVDITPDADSGLDPFSQHYSAGDLEHFAPSMDGEEPVDLDADDPEEMEGVFALRVGKREQLNNNSNWAHFLRALRDAGYEGDFGARVDEYEGVYGHFNRIPQQKRSGIVTGGDEKDTRAKTILVVTEIKEAPKAAKGGKAETKGKAAPAGKSKDEGDDIDERLAEIIVEALGEADDNTLAKKSLPALAIKGGFKGADKAKAVKRISTPDFLESREEFVFDADEGTLTLAE